MTAQPAVFLDRDGVINREEDYVHRLDEFRFLDGVFDACLRMRRAGYRLIVITNQAGIARGYYSEEDFRSLTNWMLAEFRRHGVEIDAVYHCPHHPRHGLGEYRRDCDCRKPAPGMILRAAAEHSLDLPRSVLVGDKTTDVEAGRAAGVGCCVLVRSGHPLDEADVAAADSVFENLPEVASALSDNQLCAGSGA